MSNDLLENLKAQMEGKFDIDLNVDDDLKELQKEVGMDFEKDDKDYDFEEELTSKFITKKLVNNKDDKKENDNKKKKYDLDPELEELEKEGLDDIEISDDEIEDNKNSKIMNKDLIQSLLHSSMMISKDIKKKENENETKKNEKVKDDIYFENTENKYHSIKCMKCLSTLDNEIKVCDEIIKFKKDNKYENEDIWESKKVLLQTNFKSMNNFVENGAIGIDEYKKIITNELKYNEQLFNIITKDKNLKEIEIPELKNRINKRIELIKGEIKQLEENQNEEEEEEDNSNVPKDNKLNNTLLKIVKDKYNEYSKAIEYFKKNNLEEQLNKANHKLKQLEKAKKNIEELYSQRVKEDSLPGEITPEFINGCSTNERISKFKEILKEMIIQKNNLNKDVNEINTKIKNLKASELQLVESELKNDLNSKKEKVTLYEKLINIIKQCSKDKWVPVPIYQKEDKIEKIEAFNELVEKNVLNIHIGKIEEIKESNLVLEVRLDIGKGYADIVYQKKDKTFDYNIDWIIEKEYKDIYKYDLDIIIKQKGQKSKSIGFCKIKLANLKSKCIIYSNYPIELSKKNDKIKPKIQVKVSMRVPCVDTIYKEKKTPIYVIKKIYPSFKGEVIKIDFNLNFDSLGDNFISQKKSIKSQNDSSEKKIDNTNQNKNPNIQNKKTNNTNQNISESKNVNIDVNQFKKEELVDPDIIDNLNSMEVLKNKKLFYEAKAKKIEGRTPKELREKINKITVKITILENQLGEQIQPADYLNILKKQLIHDKSLYQYFIQIKNNDNASLVKPRIENLQKEIQELEKYINQ